MAALGFVDMLEARVAAVDSLLCVGLDPHSVELPEPKDAAAAEAFCARLIDATSDVAAAYKPNAAFFEALGAPGVAALRAVIARVPAGIPVLLDNKRGDIGSTSAAYATASYDALGAHAVTINGYMGWDAVSPFVPDAATPALPPSPDRGAGGAPVRAPGFAFVLCKTSNASSSELQELALQPAPGADGGADAAPAEAVYERVARRAAGAWSVRSGGRVGLVVGATDLTALTRARALAPELWILAPGVGAQGADAATACAAGLAVASNGSGRARASRMLVPVSRGISRAADPAVAARALVDEINAARDAAVAAAAAPPAPPAGAATGASRLAPHQEAFIRCAIAKSALQFGEFTLKSGRVSPYFFNAGKFATGGALAAIAGGYARAIEAAEARGTLVFDVLFGPAYKGIPLAGALALALAAPAAAGGAAPRDVPFAYNRKEAKDHGEGGVLVGAPLAGKRVLVVDDVITAGTAIREAVGILEAAGATLAGVVLALDRQERTGPSAGAGAAEAGAADGAAPCSAVQAVERQYGVPVISIVDLGHLIEFARDATASGESGIVNDAQLAAMMRYRDEYGV